MIGLKNQNVLITFAVPKKFNVDEKDISAIQKEKKEQTRVSLAHEH